MENKPVQGDKVEMRVNFGHFLYQLNPCIFKMLDTLALYWAQILGHLNTIPVVKIEKKSSLFYYVLMCLK